VEKKQTETLTAFDTSLLSAFQFGDPDGKLDEVLTHSAMVVRGAREFLAGNKAIVLGERGAGKSALFKLLAEGTFKFAEPSDKQLKPLVVAIDNEMHYLAVANVVEERFEDKSKRAAGKYLFLWEIFLLATIIRSLVEAHSGDVEATTLETDFGDVLGIQADSKHGISDFFARFRFSVGTKFEQSGAVTPTLSVEPVRVGQDARRVTDHEIAQFRERVRKFIRAKKRVVYVLVDRVDDFVTDQAYEEQKKNVQALVDCIQNYRYPELKLKVFLRADIFAKLNFERGIDKIATQVVRLEWSSDDICEFVARRLLYNYHRVGVRLPNFNVSMALLDADPSTREKILQLFRSRPKSRIDSAKTIAEMLFLTVKVNWSNFRKKSYTARKTNSLDEAFRRFVTLVFPSRVAHMSVYCKREELSIQQFLATHFVLGGQGPNPRLVLLFLQSVFEDAAEYYARNPDRRAVPANGAGEYELLLNEHVLSGYRRTQELARRTLAALNSKWTKKVEKLFTVLKHPVHAESLSLAEIRQITKWDSDDDDFRRFVAFYTHVGLLEDETRGTGKQYGDRSYCLPIVLRTCERSAGM